MLAEDRPFFPARQIDGARRPQLLIVEKEPQLLGAGWRLGDHPQPQIFAANKGPGTRGAGRHRAGIVGQIALELARQELQWP